MEENLSLMPVAEYNATKPTITDGDIARLQTDTKQRLIVTGDTAAPVPVTVVSAVAADRYDIYGSNGTLENSALEVDVPQDSLAVLCSHTITNGKEAFNIRAAGSTLNGKSAQLILRLNDGGATPVLTVKGKRTIHGSLAPNPPEIVLSDAYEGDGVLTVEVCVEVKQAGLFFAELHLEERTV